MASLALVAIPFLAAATLYVAPPPLGSDVTGNGSEATPYATIRHAVSQSGFLDTIRVLRDPALLGRGCALNLTVSCTTDPDCVQPAPTGDLGPCIDLPTTYHECIDTRGAPVEIVADDFEDNNRRDTTIIDGTGICDSTSVQPLPAVQLGNLSSLRGFTVKGGGESGVRGAGSITITQNVITGNTAGYGSGIYAVSSLLYPGMAPITIDSNDVHTNTAISGGGGVFVQTQTDTTQPLRDVILQGNTIRNNTTTGLHGRGAGVFIQATSSATGGGQTKVVVTRNTIDGNSNTPPDDPTALAYGGGIWAESGASFGTHLVEITDNTVTNNHSGGQGGGIGVFTESSPGSTLQFVVTRNTIEGNISETPPAAFGGYGGGIWAGTYGYGSETIEIGSTRVCDLDHTVSCTTSTDCDLPLPIGPCLDVPNQVRNNEARTEGGGISAWVFPRITGNQTILLDGNSVSANTARCDGGGLDVLMFGQDLPPFITAELSVTNNEVTGNSVTDVCFDAALNEFGFGGGLLATIAFNRTAAPNATFEIEGNDLRSNTASLGGAGAMFLMVSDADPDQTGQIIAPAQAHARFVRNLVANNTATNSQDDAAGGGVFASLQAYGEATTTLDVDFATVANNTSDLGAGGIEVSAVTDIRGPDDGEAVLNVTNSIIANNEGSGIDGPAAGGTGHLTINMSYNDVFGNTAGNYGPLVGAPNGPGNISVDPLLSALWVPGICSPTVDTADPAPALVGAEPEPNGNRANMGHLGGTAEATITLPDINSDRIVDGIDILRIASSFASISGTSPHYYAPADLDTDGDVDGDDLAPVASFFGTTCP